MRQWRDTELSLGHLWDTRGVYTDLQHTVSGQRGTSYAMRGNNVEVYESLPVWLRVGGGWDMLSESVPKMSHETKEKRLALLKALDFLSGAEGDRTPDLMTASHALSHLSYSPSLFLRALARVQEPQEVVKSSAS